MSALDKVIEKYAGIHRRSIVERDVQNIYDLAIEIISNKINKDSISSTIYYCKCLQKEIIIDVEQDDIEFAQCYGDINKIVIVYPKNNLWDILDNIYLGFQASLYCLLWDLVNDKSYKLKKHKYKSFGDSFDINSVEDLHDLAVLILNENDNENKDKTICFVNPPSFYKPKFFSI